MTAWSIISLVFGTIGVWLTIRQTIWCWPFAIIATITSAIDFLNARLFGDMSLQLFYFVSGVYGWAFWRIKSKETFVVTHLPNYFIWLLIAVTLLQWLVYYFILNYFHGDSVIADAGLTAASVTATYMMTRKWLQNWWCWILIDVLYVLLYLYKGLYLYALLYFIFTAMSVYGAISWKHLLKQNTYA
jgi:nicotinamide mononucleotide transporter